MKTSALFNQKAVETAPHIYTQGFKGDNLMVTHLVFAAGAVGTRHTHPHEQMTVVLRGEMEFTLGEERKVLKTGDVIAIPSNIEHSVVALTETELLDIFTPVPDDLAEKLGV
jgi:quercetin dioxygenase-like cupin family protein